MSEDTVYPGWTRLVKNIAFFLDLGMQLSVMVIRDILFYALVLQSVRQL